MAPPSLELGPGALLAEGRFRIEGKLGEGGMGAVYAATQLELDRPVALKVLPAHGERDPSLHRRLRDEALAASRLRHPALVQVYDAGVDPRIGFWVAFEYVDGRSLRELLREEGPPGWPATWTRVGDDLLAALGACHDAGIIHRDVKPENVLVRRDGGAKLADLGLALFEGRGARTSTGLFIGSPGYFPPERTRSDRPDAPSGDLYAAAVLLVECICGRLPFEGKNLAVMLQEQIHHPPDGARLVALGIPAPVATLLAPLFDPDPERRPSSAPDLRDGLAACARRTCDGTGRGTVALRAPRRRASTPDGATRPAATASAAPKRRAPIVAAWVLATLLVVVLLQALGRDPSSSGPAPPTSPSTPWTELERWMSAGCDLDGVPSPETWDALHATAGTPAGRSRLDALRRAAFPRSSKRGATIRGLALDALDGVGAKRGKESCRRWEKLLSETATATTSAALAWDGWLLVRYWERLPELHPLLPDEVELRERLLDDPLDPVIRPRLLRLARSPVARRRDPLLRLQRALLESLARWEDRRIGLEALSPEELHLGRRLWTAPGLEEWRRRSSRPVLAASAASPPPLDDEATCRLRAERAFDALEDLQTDHTAVRRRSILEGLGHVQHIAPQVRAVLEEMRRCAFALEAHCIAGPRRAETVAALSELLWEFWLLQDRELAGAASCRLALQGRFRPERILPRLFLVVPALLPLLRDGEDGTLQPVTLVANRWFCPVPERGYAPPEGMIPPLLAALPHLPRSMARDLVEARGLWALGDEGGARTILGRCFDALFGRLAGPERPSLDRIRDLRAVFATYRGLLGNPAVRAEATAVQERLQNRLRVLLAATPAGTDRSAVLVGCLVESWHLGIDLLRPPKGPSLDDSGEAHPELRRAITGFCDELDRSWKGLNSEVDGALRGFRTGFARRDWIDPK